MVVDRYARDAFVCANCNERASIPREVRRETPADIDEGAPITEDDLLPAPQVEEMMRREASFFQEVYDYTQEKYDEDCRLYAKECPDYIELEPELFYKQIYTWFVCEKVLPSTGRTILEEFVERSVAPRDPAVAGRMLQAKDVIRGSFKVLDKGRHPYVPVEHLGSGRRYMVVTKMDEAGARRFFTKGSVITGKMHPWGERYHMFAGVLKKQESDEEFARRVGLVTPSMMEGMMERLEEDQVGRYEANLVSGGTTLRSAMNKYPSQWVDAICAATGIDIRVVRTKNDKARAVVSKLEQGFVEELMQKKLDGRHLAALRMLRENDWVVKYGQLARRFSTDTGFWWNDHPPKSEIGVLRLHGLVVVGRLPERGRLYKVAVVPLELRAPMKRFFMTPPRRKEPG